MAVSHRGAISFGMVHIPVGLYTATQDVDIHFNQLCKEDGSRVKYKKVCASCGKEVGPGDIIKGFEYEKGKYVTLTDDDFEKAKSEKDKTIHILHFTDLQNIRPIYFDSDGVWESSECGLFEDFTQVEFTGDKFFCGKQKCCYRVYKREGLVFGI